MRSAKLPPSTNSDDDEARVAVPAHVEHRHDARVLQPCNPTSLGHEPFGGRQAALLGHLDGDRPAQLQVVALPDLGETALGDLLVETIPAGEGAWASGAGRVRLSSTVVIRAFHPGRDLQGMDSLGQERGQVRAVPAQLLGGSLLPLLVQFLPAEQKVGQQVFIGHHVGSCSFNF